VAVLVAILPAAVLGIGPATAAGRLPLPMEEGARRQDWHWPLDPVPAVVRAFDPPSSAWDAAHRGVDLAGSTAQQVLAVGGGRVSYAGVIAGRGVVVVDHGGLRSTYEPVTALVRTGDAVSAGQVIGLLQAVGSHCSPATCLHLGVRRGHAYLDPLTLLAPVAIRLKPLAGLAQRGFGPLTPFG
jgi:murein DD-endopeptidase MepM/ murein hydrolase activator NlpD